MILSGKEIVRQWAVGNIDITDFDPDKVNPNSYNLKLHEKLLVYDMSKNGFILDMKKKLATTEIIIPESGLTLEPGKLYLGRTLEKTRTDNLVPMLEGRSSIGRLGMFIHVTAGFGDVGFNGYWTLEISVIHPLTIYPNIEICQIYYHTVNQKDPGDYITYSSRGKYQDNHGIQASMMYKDFE